MSHKTTFHWILHTRFSDLLHWTAFIPTMLKKGFCKKVHLQVSFVVVKTYVVGTQKDSLTETVLLSTQNKYSKMIVKKKIYYFQAFN